MITDPAEVRRLLGWTDDKIAALKAASTWAERADLLLALLQPPALLRGRPWWLQETPAMALETWMAEQDRAGVNVSPVFAVPPGMAECRVVLDCVGFTNEVQSINVELGVSFNEGVAFDGGGSGLFYGGPAPTKKDGTPGPREIICQLLAENYPTHAKVTLTVAGTVNCGVSVEFLPATP